MKILSSLTTFKKLSRLFMAAAASVFLFTTSQAQTASVVISQVYGGGGNTGATYTHDYVELFNGSSSPVSLNGWSIQYASATGSSWGVTALTNTTLAPGQYYLIRLATGGAVGSALPAFDVSGTTNMSATAGKVALVNSTTALPAVTCPTTGIIDFIGFGSTANCFEGAGLAPAGSNTLALFRAASGCTDSNNNSSDFASGTPAPRNTSTALNPCTAPCTAPAFTSCPAPISTSTGTSTCNAVVNYSVTASGTGPVSYSYSFSGATTATGSGNGSGSTFTVGVTNVVVTASNSCGSATCSFTVTVADNTPPTAVCQNVTVNLDAFGNASITPAQVNNGSSDNCGTVNLVSVVPNTFTCSNLSLAAPAGDLFISEYIEGTSNNKCIEIFNGTGAPVDLGAGGYQLLVYFNGSTTAGLTFNLSGTVAAGDVHVVCQSSSAPQFLAVADQTSSSAWHNGDDAIVLRKGGSIILDIIGRIGEDPGSEWGTGLTSTADNTIIRNANIAAGVTANPSTGFPTLASEWTGFSTDYSSGLGAHTFTPPPVPTAVTLTINDGNGNTSTCIAQVTIIDNIAPSITTCAPNQDVNLNGTCQLVVPNLVAQTTATDNCSAVVTQSPAAGTVLASGHNQTHVVTITATDASGNAASCTVTLTGKDVTPPTAVCQNVTVQLDNNGQGSITAAQVNNGSSDNCGTVNLVSVSPNTFSCLNLSVPVPPSVWINEIHYDNSGADAGEFIELAGTAGINLADYALVRYNGSNPLAAVIYTSSAQITTLTGTIPSQSNGYGTFAVFYAADGLQNGTADGVALVNTATNTVVQLLSYEGVFTVAAGQGAASGMTSTDIGVSETGTLTGGSVRLTGLGNQYSNFTWQPESAPASPGAINPGQSFPAAANTVTLTVNDGNGNTSTCTANVTVLDQIAPVAVCQNISVNLDANGNASITAMQVNNGSSDNCGVVSMTVSPSSFTCANVGPNTVTLTVTDASGNSHSCTATVTVVDNIAPTAVCQNLTVYLDAFGAASITASQIDNGSSDICGIANISVSPSAFTCADLSTGQANATGLFFSEYVEGSSNNKYIEIFNGTGANVDLSNYQLRLYSNGSAAVTTTSSLSGILANGQTVVYRNSSAVIYAGTSTAASAVNWNGDDAIALYNTVTGQNVDIFGVIGNDPGASWTAAGGYTTVDRTLRRKANVLSGVATNPSGTGPSAFSTLASEWDVISIDDVSGLGSHTFNPGPVGSTVTLTVTDVNGNSSTCNATVVVLDTISPFINCPAPISVNNDAGLCGAVVNYNIGFGDNCSGSTIQQTAGLASGNVFPIGTTVNTFVVTDAAGNTDSCSFAVTVTDVEAPYFTNVPSNFSACNPVFWTAPTPNDNCPGASVTSSHQPGDIFTSGTTTVTYTVTDAAGLQSTVSFDVTLLEPSVAANNMTSNRDYDNICVGEAITLTINGGSLGAGAQWVWYSGSCGGTPVASGVTSITVSPTATTTYYARAEGTCNNTACVQLTVVVSTGAPTVTPTYTYLPAYGAPGITDSLVVAPVPGATYYRWFTNNGQINGVQFNMQLSPVQTAAPRVDVTFVLSQQNYQLRVIAGNACGRSGQRNATVRGTVAAPTSLTGPTTVCPNQTHSYTVSAIPSQSGNTQVTYNWQLIPSNAGTISGTGLTRTITFAPGFNGAQLCVNGISSFGLAGTPLCINIVTGAPAPAMITGTNSVCEGASGISYSATPVAGAISYNWTSVPAGVIFSGNTANVTATFPAGSWSGTICVAAVTSTCGTSQPTCINVSTITPGVLSGITGPVSGVCLESNVNYTTDAGATSYSWTLPSGATGSSSTSSINVNFGAGFTSGTIEVTGIFACNTSTTSINVTGAPATPSVATGGLSSICPGASGVQYSVVSTGATEFNWTASGVATTSGCANPPLCSSYDVDSWGMTPSLSVTAENSCGVSDAFAFPVGCRIAESTLMNTSVYPNPTSGKFNIEFTSSAKADHTIRITDLAGRVVAEKEVSSAAGTNVVSFDMSEQGAGMYLVHITDQNGAASVTRIAVE